MPRERMTISNVKVYDKDSKVILFYIDLRTIPPCESLARPDMIFLLFFFFFLRWFFFIVHVFLKIDVIFKIFKIIIRLKFNNDYQIYIYDFTLIRHG